MADSSGEACFLLEILLGEPEGINSVVRKLAEEEHARDTGQSGGCSRGKSPELVELDSRCHPQGVASSLFGQLQREEVSFGISTLLHAVPASSHMRSEGLG